MKMTPKPLIAALPVLLALAWAPPARSADAPLPAWEQLEAAQRELLVAPLRERWDSHPEDRRKMLERAGRWQELTPEQRKRAHRGMDRWKHMTPEQRENARALYSHMRSLSPEAREELRREWKKMSPEQQRAWARAHPAPARDD